MARQLDDTPVISHLLDTHAWVWLLNEDPRGRPISQALPGDARVGISAMTIWEAAMQEAKGRLHFQPDLAAGVREMLERDLCAIVPLLPEIAIASTRLAGFHNNPADRIIVATVIHTNAVLVTADAKILAWAKATGRVATLAL